MVRAITVLLLFICTAGCRPEIVPGDKSIELFIKERKLIESKVTVAEGDSVTFIVDSDEEGEFHLAGYEIISPLSLSEKTTVAFKAELPGRYSIEFHPKPTESDGHDHDHGGSGEDIVLGSLIVMPK